MREALFLRKAQLARNFTLFYQAPSPFKKMSMARSGSLQFCDLVNFSGRWLCAGDGARLMMLVLHDDAQREYAYGPAQGLPDTKIGTFTQALYDEAKRDGWIVISMKDDWKRIFVFE